MAAPVAMSTSDLAAQLGIRAWDGASIFLSSVPSPSTPTPKVNQIEIADSPISISSSSSSSSSSSLQILSSPPSQALSRSRAVPRYASPLARTAFTPPRALAATGVTSSTPSPSRGTPLHPFFIRPRNIPQPSQPRKVAYYSSTSEATSESQGSSSSTGTGTDSQRSGNEGISADVSRVTDEILKLGFHEKSTVRQPLVAAQTIPVYPSIRRSVDSKPAKTTTWRKPALTGKAPLINISATSRAAGLSGLDSLKSDISSDDLTLLSISTPLFSHRSPPTPHFSRPPAVVYTSSSEEADDLVSCLRGPVLGFDLEWPPPGQGPVVVRTRRDGTEYGARDGVWNPETKRYTWPENRVAVIQICDDRTIIIFQLVNGARPGPGLVNLLTDPKRLKCGVQVGGDARKLVRDFPNLFAPQAGGVAPAGLLELSSDARKADLEVWQDSRGPLIGLAKLAKHYLGRELDKDMKVRSGAWDLALSPAQIEYAANDVYASFLVHRALARRAEERNITLDHSTLRPSSYSAMKGRISFAPTVAPELVDALGPSVANVQIAPCKARALALFARGANVASLADTLKIKETTVRWYIVQAALAVPLESLDSELRRRIVEDAAEGSYIQKAYSSFLSTLREDNGSASSSQ